MKLTNANCKSAKPDEKTYKLADGGGLFLVINPNGSKLWRLKYRYVGKEKTLSLGAYPLVSLLEARDGRDKAKKLLLNMVDPAEEWKKKKREIIRKT